MSENQTYFAENTCDCQAPLGEIHLRRSSTGLRGSAFRLHTFRSREGTLLIRKRSETYQDHKKS